MFKYSLLLVIGFMQLLSCAHHKTLINVPGDQPTIQEGIIAAEDGDTVLVDAGTYYECVDFLEKNIVVASHFILDGDTVYIHQTIIDGSQGSGGVLFPGGQDSSSIIEGFTIRNGSMGIQCQNSSPTIRNNVISDHYYINDCGGIRIIQHSNPTIIRNVIKNNNSGTWGGGIYVSDGCSPYIAYNIIIDNGFQIRNEGRQLKDQSGETTFVEGLLYTGNAPPSRASNGGGIVITNNLGEPTSPVIINNTICGNNVSGNGGGIFCNAATPVIRNNIISSNSGYGIYAQGGAIKIDYNDVWNNPTNYGGTVVPDTGDIQSDPMFIDSVINDFHLQAGSPCIDVGDPAAPLDPDGTTADMGALYFDQTPTIE